MIYRGRVSRIVNDEIYVQISTLAVDQDFGPMEVIDPSGYSIDDYVLVTQIEGAAEDLVIIGLLRPTLEDVVSIIPAPTQDDSFLGGAAAGTLSWKTKAQTKTALDIDDLETEVQPVNRGGTGKTSYTVGNYLQATGTTTLSERTPAQVKSDIGLGNVDNTSDLAKPISTATQAALDTKSNSEGGSSAVGLDFNTLITPQTTAFGVVSSAASTNTPEGVRGILTVMPAGGSGGYLVQRYHTIDTNRIWSRTYILATATWTSWASTYGAMVELGNAVDLNTITKSGLYIQSQSAEAAAGSNYPTPFAGMLEVYSNNGTIFWQRYTTTRDYGNVVFTRSSTSGAWTSWVCVSGAGWQTLPMTSDWTDYGSTYRVAQYKVEGSTVRLRGLIKATVALSTTSTIATLSSYAPTANEPFLQVSSTVGPTGAASTGTAHTHNYGSGSMYLRIDVTSTGAINAMIDGGRTFVVGSWVSLSRITWDY